jgi:transposase
VVYVGIDVGKRNHEASLMNQHGQEIIKPLRFPNTVAGVSALINVLRPLEQPSLIALEASGHYWLGLHRKLTQAGFPVLVVNPLQTNAYRATSVRKVKTDRRDSFVIADFLRIGRIVANYVPDDTTLKLRELTRFRFNLIDQIGDTKRKVLATLDRVFPEYEGLFSDVFIKSSRALLNKAVSAADFASFDLSQLASILNSASRGRFGFPKVQQIQLTARSSLGLPFLGKVASVKLRSLLAHIEFLENEVSQIDAAIAELMQGLHQHLTDIKGIGSVLAATILAEIGDITRFKRMQSLVAYSGIDPSVFQSGNFIGTQRHMSKRGSPYLRRALWLAAHTTRLYNSDLNQYFHSKSPVP